MRKSLLAVLVPFLLAGLSTVARASAGDEDLRALVQQLLKEVKELKKENAELRSELEKLKTQKVPVTAPSQKKASFFSKGAYGSEPSGVDLYGYFKIDAVWQDNSATGVNFLAFVPREDDDNKFTLNFRQSRIGLDLWKTYSSYKVFGKFEMDFYYRDQENDNHAAIRARRVYAGFQKGTWQIMAGLDWQTISQLAPHTLHFLPLVYMGNPGFRMVQVRATKMVPLEGGKLKLQVAAEQPLGAVNTDYIRGDTDPSDDAGFPGVEARIAYESKLFGKPALLALWGHYSQEEYDIASGEEDVDSYSLGLEVKVPLPISFVHKAFLSGEIWMGRNFDGFYSASVAQGVVFSNGTAYQTAYFADATEVEEVDAVGGWIELQLFWTPKLVTHFGFGVDNPDNDDLDRVTGARLQQRAYFANILYRVTKSVGVGLEYMYVDCDYRGQEDADLNRFMASFMYYF